jgi:ABC-2 type transport system permease protein
MRTDHFRIILGKEWIDLRANKLLLAAVVAPAFIFAAIPTAIVWILQVNEIPPERFGQMADILAAFPGMPPKLAAQGFIVSNFMAYFLLIPAMVPMVIASQSVIGERQTRSLEPQLATPLEIPEFIAAKTVAAAAPALLATWLVYVLYGLVNGWIADPRLRNLIFSDVWLVAMLTLVPLISLFSVLLGVIVSSRVDDPRVAQQVGGFVVLPIIAVAVLQFLGGQATFTMNQVLMGDALVAGAIGVMLIFGSWAFDREGILTRLA